MLEDPVLRVLACASVPTMATILGSALVFLRVSLDERFVDACLGFGSGLMVYVAFAELLIPSLELGGSGLTMVGFLSGLALIKALDLLIPHARVVRGAARRNLTLVALAVAIHNVPEGLAVGSTSLYSFETGVATALAIAAQDVPEGLVVALVVAETGGPVLGFLVGALTALSEFTSAAASLVGLIDVATSMPILLALSAGAMIYVVVHEVAPEIFGHEHDEHATLGFVVGLMVGLII